MILDQAITAANQVKDLLAKYCEKIEVAGSIRRQRPECNDIDLVCLPIPGQEAALRVRIGEKTKLIQSGEKILSTMLDWRPSAAHPDGVRLDIYFAHAGIPDMIDPTPGNWGSVLLCRTGSKEHNAYLCKVAQDMGCKWEPARGIVCKGKVIASETEEDIFRALDLEFVNPEMRERP